MHYLCVVLVVEVVYITMIPFGRRQHTVIDHISASLARMDALLSDLKIQATAASDQHCGLCCGCRSGIHNDAHFIFEALRDGPSLKHYMQSIIFAVSVVVAVLFFRMEGASNGMRAAPRFACDVERDGQVSQCDSKFACRPPGIWSSGSSHSVFSGWFFLVQGTSVSHLERT